MAGQALDSGAMTGLATGAELQQTIAAIVRAGMEAVAKGKAFYERRKALSAIAGDSKRLREILPAYGYKPSTSGKYARLVFQFLREVGGVPEWSDVHDYLKGMKAAGKSNGTVRTMLCALRAVFDKILRWEITKGIEHLPPPLPLPGASGEQVSQLLLAAADLDSYHLVTALHEHHLMPHEIRRLGRRNDAEDDAAGTTTDEKGMWAMARAGDSDEDPQMMWFTVQEQEDDDIVWLFESPGRSKPLCTRTLQRVMAKLAAGCDIETTCTAVRLSEDPVVLSAA